MQRYIEQLIEDINRATWNVKPPSEIWDSVDTDSELEMEDISHVEKYMYGEKEPVGSITGIDAELLPPAEKLTTEQQALLAGKLEELLRNFHFQLEFPVDLPAHFKYPFIKQFWTEEHVAMSFGTNHIEFCDMDEAVYCPFPGYCNTCKEVAEQMKYDEEQHRKSLENKDVNNNGDDDLPF